MTTIAPVTKVKRSYGDRIDDVTCMHGTHVGWPGGPDYICGYCEDGAYTKVTTTRYELQARIMDAETGQPMMTYPVNMHGNDAVWYGWQDPFVVWPRIEDIAVRDQQLLAKYGYGSEATWYYEYTVEVTPYGWWE